MKFLPSKKQWKDWSLPSKITYISFILGLFGIALTLVFRFFPNESTIVIDRDGNHDEFLKKMANPLPSDFILKNFTIFIKIDSLKEYLPIIKKQVFDEKLGYKNYNDNGEITKRGIELSTYNRSEKLLNLFENKDISWNMYLLADENQTRNGSSKFLLTWWFRDKLSFKDNRYKIYYEVDHLNQNEYLKIVLHEPNSPSSSAENYINYGKNSIISAVELCDKKVLIPISAGNFNGSNVYFESISFKDNNSKRYSLKFLGHQEIINESGKEFISKTIFEKNQRMASLIEDEKDKEMYKSMPKINFPPSSMFECVSKFNCLSIK